MSSSPSEATYFLSSNTIIIAGAGIAGLTFCIALAHHFPGASRPKVIVYERDSYEIRIGREGYSLSLRTDNRPGGIQVLDFLDMYERVRAVSVNAEDATEERGRFNIWDQNFRSIFRFPMQPFGPKKLTGMRIRRNALQKVLAEAAAEAGAEIHWGTAVNDAQSTEDGKMRVSLSDGRTELCDILIAADGSRSKIRSVLRPNDRLDYTGYYTWGGTTRFAHRGQIPKPVDRDWGVLLGGKGIGLFVSPVDDKSVLWGLSRASREPQERLRYPILQERLNELMEESTKVAANFSPVVKDLIAATDPSTVMQVNAMDRPPFPHLPSTYGPVIWIGDANHAVSPFAGNGANMAIMDSWDLASCFKKTHTLEEALAAYDQISVPRARRVLKVSRWSIDLAHATGLKLILYKIVIRIMGYLTGVPF
ncbi:uncharacterized protein Z518_10965 [Rhinocladiella mackenziei CBS 650.93]|uniref:FAD-binding domain-containing protein n=1 Tax=Rhinocladiella mackenziei CBS 650.93 TaxID=1442369 RepID=A0A0D2GNZ4_9EURO|nr:uncharacterized protein Z518_10965 [Rhinocladiella mackenziei CBS 650.93]KIX00038.1 hypothetical protein Z518_10965 [Rhinocladiella mackenziei CBS 650.93]